MDASDIVWFGSKKASLYLTIDNATGLIVGAYFDWRETLNGYYHVFEQILKDYGIPLCFKTDNRTVFNYETAKTKAEHKHVLTQFDYACRSRGVGLKLPASLKPRAWLKEPIKRFKAGLSPN